MRKFDYLEVLKPDIKDEEIEKHIEKIKKYLLKKDCKNIKTEKIGIKKLAYDIKGYNKGYYILFTAEAGKEEYKQIEKYLYTKNTSFCKTYPEVIKNISVIDEDY